MPISPELSIGRRLGITEQLIPGCPEEVPPLHISEGPPPAAVIGHGDLEHATRLQLVRLAGDVPEGVHCQVLPEVRAEADVVLLAARC